MKKALGLLFLVLAVVGCSFPISPPTPQGILVAVGSGGMIARSTDNGGTWQVSMGTQSKVWNGGRTDLIVDGNLQVNGELNRGRFAQIDSIASAVSQITGTGFLGDLYTRGTLYQELGQQWVGPIANPFGVSGIRGIAFGNNVFVAVGVVGKVARSLDYGATWGALVGYPVGTDVYAIDFGNSVFVAVGANGKICTSSDNGATWSSIANPFGASTLTSVAFGSGVFVAVSSAGKIARSIDNGATWGGLTSFAAGFFSVKFGNGVFVIVDGSANILVSKDLGVTWTVVASSVLTSGYQLSFGNGVFIVIGGSGQISRSLDYGSTWSSTITNPFGVANLASISYNLGIFTVGSFTGLIARSYDNGLTWGSLISNPFGTNVIYGIASSPQTTPGTGNMVAVGAAGSIATAGWNACFSIPPTWSGVAPLPQAAARVGQWDTYNSVASKTLGAGGTWVWDWTSYSTVTGFALSHSGGFSAGGTVIAPVAGNTVYSGWAWRIA